MLTSHEPVFEQKDREREKRSTLRVLISRAIIKGRIEDRKDGEYITAAAFDLSFSVLNWPLKEPLCVGELVL